MIQPLWWEKAPDNAVRCGLCHHACVIAPGTRSASNTLDAINALDPSKMPESSEIYGASDTFDASKISRTAKTSGYCKARHNNNGELSSPWLGRFSSIAVDPIEKKPLYHWRPGSMILSLGSLGCTMRCPFCQNHTIANPEKEAIPLRSISPEELAATAQKMNLHAIAYTYNEPALQAEYIMAASPLLQQAGIASVLVTNGMFSEQLRQDLLPHIAAMNIDLKCFDAKRYAGLGGSLQTVKATIEEAFARKIHVEVTTLVVPGISDSPEEFAEEVAWLAHLSPDIPLHISRYRPMHKYTEPPTNIALLKRFAAIAEKRLKFVHIGNVPPHLL